MPEVCAVRALPSAGGAEDDLGNGALLLALGGLEVVALGRLLKRMSSGSYRLQQERRTSSTNAKGLAYPGVGQSRGGKEPR